MVLKIYQPPNETVENLLFAGRNALEGTQQPALGVRMRLESGHPLSRGLLERPKSVDFPDIVHRCEHCTSTLDFARNGKCFMCL